MAELANIWRHPIKSHGREAMDQVTLVAGEAMPWDRRWAVALADSAADGSQWVPCSNFSRTARNPKLAAINIRHDNATLTLTHPELDEIRFDPETPEGQAEFIEWLQPLTPKGHPAPARLLKLEGRGFTDTAFPSVTLCSFQSHRAVERQLGQEISPLRWRCNLWVNGLAAWEEFAWLDREVHIGEAVLKVRKRTDRCPATMANPETGERDVPTVQALMEGWGHKDFSVQAEVLRGGVIQTGDEVKAI